MNKIERENTIFVYGSRRKIEEFAINFDEGKYPELKDYSFLHPSPIQFYKELDDDTKVWSITLVKTTPLCSKGAVMNVMKIYDRGNTSSYFTSYSSLDDLKRGVQELRASKDGTIRSNNEPGMYVLWWYATNQAKIEIVDDANNILVSIDIKTLCE